MSNEETLFVSDDTSIVWRACDVRGVPQSFDTACRPQTVISAVTDDTSGMLVLVRQYPARRFYAPCLSLRQGRPSQMRTVKLPFAGRIQRKPG